MRFVGVTLLSAVIGYLHSNAQSFTIYNYSIAEGLPSSEVYEVYQDKKGFIWFATDNGVVKFDGSRMTTYHTNDGLTDPVVFSFFEDNKGRLWFRTFSGRLCYLENDVIKKYKHNDILAPFNNKGIFSYVVNEKDELWFTSWNNFGKVDSAGNLSVGPVLKEGVFLKSIGDNFLLGNSSINYMTPAIIIDDKEFPISQAPVIHYNSVLRGVKVSNKIFLSLNREVFQYDGNTITKVLTAPKPVINLSADEQDNIWVGYMNGGVERYEPNNFTLTWKPDFLINKSVTKVIYDHEGGLWITTLENGVYHLPNLLIEHFPLQSTSRIRGVLKYHNKVLTGDQGGKLFEIDLQTKETKLIKTIRDPLLSIFTNGKKVFISAHDSICVFDNNLNFERKYAGIANDFAKAENGVIFSFGGYRLMQFDELGNQIKVDIIRVPYRAIHIEDTLIFMADRTGLHIRNKDLDLLHIKNDLADVKISNIQKLNDSTTLITTIGKGFILMNTSSLDFKIFNSAHNFIADHIYSSLLTEEALWLGTEKGLIKIPADQLAQPNFHFEYLTKKSGLMSDKVDFLVHVDNSIWAFSENNFSVIPISFSMFANKKPLFYIHEVRVNEQLIKFRNIFDLSHWQNNIQITFGFISFNNQNILLRYRLNSSDDWIYTTNKHLLFPSLAPGHYNFDLQYSTDNVRWLSAMTHLNFIITSPWWAKWYTLLSFLLILLFLGVLYFRYLRSIYIQKNHYLKIITDHQQKLIQSEITTRERERNRISKELHDRVGTNLTAIKLTVRQLLKTHNDPLAEDVEEQFQVAIKEIKDIIYGLTPPGLERYGLFTGLKNYVGKLIKSIPIHISLKTFGKDIHNYELNIILFRILQELLSNTVKHSFAKNITIHINSFDDILNIMYEDDGVGFARNPEKSGLGLDNIESRIQSINGSMKFESGNFGTSYTIDIPVTINKGVI